MVDLAMPVSLVPKGGPAMANSDYSQGHEGCGEIIQIGSDVNDQKFQIVSTIILCIHVWISPEMRRSGHLVFDIRAYFDYLRETRSQCLLFQAAARQHVWNVLETFHNFVRPATIRV